MPSYAISIIVNPTFSLSFFTDDIITPVYVAPTRSPTTFRPKHHKEDLQRPSCDDEEDCEEGSGEPVTTEEIFVTSATGPFHFILYFLFVGFARFLYVYLLVSLQLRPGDRLPKVLIRLNLLGHSLNVPVSTWQNDQPPYQRLPRRKHTFRSGRHGGIFIIRITTK